MDEVPGNSRAMTKMGNGAKMKNKKNQKLSPLEDPPTPTMNSSMKTNNTMSITRKKDLVEAVRRVHPSSVKTAPEIFWDVEGTIKTGEYDKSGLKQQINIVENGVNYSARRYNDLKISNEMFTKTLKKKLDELDEQKKTYENLEAMRNARTHESARIEALRKESEVCEKEILQKIHYTRQCEHMLDRLKRNQLKFDAHLVGMEQNLAQIKKEMSDVVLLRRNLDVGHAKAATVLEETKMWLQTARKERSLLIARRTQELKNAHMIEEWMQRREEVKASLMVELRGDLTLEEEYFLRMQIDEKMEKKKQLQSSYELESKKLVENEEIFANLKQITGVSSLEDMLEKFQSQQSNKRELQNEGMEAGTRLQQAQDVLKRTEKEFNELKSSGVNLAETSREANEDLEQRILEARNAMKLAKATGERLSGVMLGLQQGSNGLLVRTQPYKELGDPSGLDFLQGEEEYMAAGTLEALITSEQILSKMMEMITGNAAENNSGQQLKGLGAFDDDSIGMSPIGGVQDAIGSVGSQVQAGTNNVRVISLPRGKNADDFQGRTPGEVLDDKDVGKQPTEVSTTEEPVPRTAMKTSSERVAEARAKKEMSKKQRSEMVEKGEELTVHSIQKHAADRLCTTKKLVTLPPGITLRDDVMDKTTAFLKNLPDLI